MPLTDFSDVTYPVVAGGFPSPPGCVDEQRPRATRRWTRRASTLRAALLAETIEDLRVRSDAVAHVAADEPVEVLWPTDAESGTQGEFRVPELDPSYVITRGENKGRPRTLDLALPSLGPLDERPADDFDRLELVRLVAILLEGLHRVEVVTAGLNWSTFIFTLDPRPGLVMHRPEALRRLGGEFLAPGAFSGSPVTSPYDADRHAFALLASRLLVSHDAAGSLDPWNERGIPGLSRTQSVRMWKLWERSAGGAGTRPQVAEWREALGV